MISTMFKAVLLLCSLVTSSLALSQSVIQRSDTPYVEPVTAQPNPSGSAASVVAPVTAGFGVQRWEVFAEDQKLSRALWRWTQQEGIQFFWEAPNDLVAVKASYSGSFASAVLALMEDSASSAYPLRACRYDNALRIIHTSKSCKNK